MIEWINRTDTPKHSHIVHHIQFSLFLLQHKSIKITQYTSSHSNPHSTFKIVYIVHPDQTYFQIDLIVLPLVFECDLLTEFHQIKSLLNFLFCWYFIFMSPLDTDSLNVNAFRFYPVKKLIAISFLLNFCPLKLIFVLFIFLIMIEHKLAFLPFILYHYSLVALILFDLTFKKSNRTISLYPNIKTNWIPQQS